MRETAVRWDRSQGRCLATEHAEISEDNFRAPLRWAHLSKSTTFYYIPEMGKNHNHDYDYDYNHSNNYDYGKKLIIMN